MKYNFLGLVALGFIFIACDHTVKENLQLQEKVIAVHDSIMPKMGTFVRDNLKIGILLNKMDSLKKIDPELDTVQEKQKLTELQSSLKTANEEMTDWMHNFEPQQEDKTPEEIRSYLQQELEKIEALKSKFAVTEKASQQVLLKYKQ